MGWIEDQTRATRFQFPDPGVPFALDSKAMHVEKRSTGRDELDAAFGILTKWFSLTRRLKGLAQNKPWPVRSRLGDQEAGATRWLNVSEHVNRNLSGLTTSKCVY